MSTASTTTAIPRIGVVFRPQLPPERLRLFVETAEIVGLDDVWLWEDCFYEGGVSSAVAALSWSSRIRVGVGLLPVPLRNSALAAMELATVSRLFPQRFVPAVGHGVLPWMEQVGARVSSPLTLLQEWVTATRALLHGETVTVTGDYVRLDNVELEWAPVDVPPLLVGARGPKTLTLAGELADGIVLDEAVSSPNGVRAAINTSNAQRAHQVVVYVPVGADEAPGEVAQRIRTYADAGATTVVVQPAPDEPDMDATIRLAAAARELL
jgi:alkanesulfonate monooxygenase SsuD/methylene tetrahydromethanopterin reductase-like flavin-dependent oxidoreductase (luciferase family)